MGLLVKIKIKMFYEQVELKRLKATIMFKSSPTFRTLIPWTTFTIHLQ